MTQRPIALSIVSVSFAFFAGALMVAHAATDPAVSTSSAQTQSMAGVTFPIAGLGNCASQSECKTFCDQEQNMSACTSFAAAHHLISSDQAQRTASFIKALAGGQGPGGCTTEDACKAYCADASHTAECVAFAQKIGLLKGQQVAPFSQAAKLMQAVTNGKGPGGCSSKGECDSYCKDSAHAAECFTFAEKLGLVASSTAQVFQKTHGAGPGGCASQDACEAFCKDSANQQTCLDFAKTNGLLKQDDIDTIQTAVSDIRALEGVPPPVRACLQQIVGSSTLAAMGQGGFMPDSATASQLKDCFMQMASSTRSMLPMPGGSGQDGDHSTDGRGIPGASGTGDMVQACVAAKLGVSAGQISATTTKDNAALQAALQACAEMGSTTPPWMLRPFGSGSSTSAMPPPNMPTTQGTSTSGGPGPSPDQAKIRECLNETIEQFDTTNANTPGFKDAMSQCISAPPSEMQDDGTMGPPPGPQAAAPSDLEQMLAAVPFIQAFADIFSSR